MLKRKPSFYKINHAYIFFSLAVLIFVEFTINPYASNRQTNRLQRKIILSPNPIFVRENQLMNITITKEGSFLKIPLENFLWEQESMMPIIHFEAPGIIKGLQIGKTQVSIGRNLFYQDNVNQGIKPHLQRRFYEDMPIASVDVEVLPAKNIPI